MEHGKSGKVGYGRIFEKADPLLSAVTAVSVFCSPLILSD